MEACPSVYPGWQKVSLPFGTAVDGVAPDQTLHVVGVNPVSGMITYSTWANDTWTKLRATPL